MNSISTNARNLSNLVANFLSLKGIKNMLPVFILLVAFLNIAPGSIKAQSTGDYRSIITTGNPVLTPWENASSWERFNGVTWVGAVAAPNFNDGVITVRTPTYMIINANLTLDQTIVQNGATIQ